MFSWVIDCCLYFWMLFKLFHNYFYTFITWCFYSALLPNGFGCASVVVFCCLHLPPILQYTLAWIVTRFLLLYTRLLESCLVGFSLCSCEGLSPRSIERKDKLRLKKWRNNSFHWTWWEWTFFQCWPFRFSLLKCLFKIFEQLSLMVLIFYWFL